MTDKSIALRSWARGIAAVEAATELLLRFEAGRYARPGWPWVGTNPDGTAWIEWNMIAGSIGTLSSGQRRVLLIAASLGDGPPVDLHEVMWLDQPATRLVLAAFAHAAQAGPLHPWPDQRQNEADHLTVAGQ